jgi:PKD repeat protein
MVFDSAGSAASDGSSLTFDWSFGDGGRSGASKVTHLFAQAGSYTVTLTARDAAGNKSTVTQQLSIAAAAVPSAFASVAVEVRVGTSVVSGASVTVLGGASATTDSQGLATLAVGVGVPQVIQVRAGGYTTQIRRLNLANTLTTGFLKVGLAYAAQPMALNAVENGADATGGNGVRVQLPPAALVDASGTPVTGTVQATISPIDVVNETPAFPGAFSGYDSAGQAGLLLSWGTADFQFSQNGQALNLAPGARATIDLPIYAGLDAAGLPIKEGDVYPLWYLDEASGLWMQEGSGVVTLSAGSASGFVLRGAVGHFSWWNHDKFDEGYGGNGGCCIDSNFDGACDGPTMCYVRGRTNCTGSICGAGRDAATAPPAWLAEDIIASGVTKTLLFPAAYPVELEGFASNGLYSGKRIISSTAGQNVTFELVLTPLQMAQGNQVISLPHDQNYASQGAGSSSKFDFDVSVNDVLLVAVERGSGSLLEGDVRLFAPGNTSTPIESATFGSVGAQFSRTVTGGRHTVEVRALKNAPGGFRLVVKVIGTAPTVQTVSPAAGATLVAPNAPISVTFSSPMKAASVNASSFKARALAQTISGAFAVSGNTVTLTPSSNLPQGVPIRVQLTTAIQNSVNAALAQPFEWSFVPAEALDTKMTFATSGIKYLASLGDGDFGVLLHDSSTAPAQLVFVRYRPGVGILERQELSRDGPGINLQAYPLRIASNGTGSFVIVWSVRPDAGINDWRLMARFYDSTLGWRDPVQLRQMSTYTDDYVSAVMNLAGDVMVAYSDNGSPQRGWAHRYTTAAGWEPVVGIDGPSGPGAQFHVRLAMNDDGNAVAAWRNTYSAYATIYDAEAGMWGPVSDLGNAQGNVRAAAMSPEGDAFVLIVDGLDGVHVSRHLAGGSWEDRTIPSANSNSCAPQLAVPSSASVTVAACSTAPGLHTPFLARWTSGTWSTWEPNVELDSEAGGVFMRIALSPSQALDVIWSHGGAASHRRYPGPGGDWGVTPSTTSLSAITLVTGDFCADDDAAVYADNFSGLWLVRVR